MCPWKMAGRWLGFCLSVCRPHLHLSVSALCERPPSGALLGPATLHKSPALEMLCLPTRKDSWPFANSLTVRRLCFLCASFLWGGHDDTHPMMFWEPGWPCRAFSSAGGTFPFRVLMAKQAFMVPKVLSCAVMGRKTGSLSGLSVRNLASLSFLSGVLLTLPTQQRDFQYFNMYSMPLSLWSALLRTP